MPLPFIVGAAAFAGGSALIVWYKGLSKKRQKEVDDWSFGLINQWFSKSKAEDLSTSEARNVVKAVPEYFSDAPTIDAQRSPSPPKKIVSAKRNPGRKKQSNKQL